MRTAFRMLIAVMSALLAFSALSFQQTKKTYLPKGNEGIIIGEITFTGEVPRLRYIDMSFDPVCDNSHHEPTTEDVIVTDGKVANVLVYVKSNELNSYNFEPPSSPVIIERTGCQLIPHILGIQTRQTLQVLNNSRATHNTTVMPVVNPEWSSAQPPGSAPVETSFELPERLVVIKDNQHPWEKAYLGVFSHPFFMVTGKDGTYKIEGLPVGKYTIVAWHERFGEQEVQVSLGERETKTVDFTFKTLED
jgi:Carboxypeptidase regulatory-like domain